MFSGPQILCGPLDSPLTLTVGIIPCFSEFSRPHMQSSIALFGSLLLLHAQTTLSCTDSAWEVHPLWFEKCELLSR